MIKVDTGTDLVARYDDVIPELFCNTLVQYMQREKPVPLQTEGELPWLNQDNIPFSSIRNKRLRAVVDGYRFLLTQLVCQQYNTFVYPHFSDFVIWRKGMEMEFHKDDGYEGMEQNIFRCRKYSMVVYLNDNYVGGETVIQLDGLPDYVSKPKTGSVVIFKANDQCVHRVNRVEEGTRYTMANWFATDIDDVEVVDKY